MKEVIGLLVIGAILGQFIGWWAIILPIGFWAIGEAYTTLFGD